MPHEPGRNKIIIKQSYPLLSTPRCCSQGLLWRGGRRDKTKRDRGRDRQREREEKGGGVGRKGEGKRSSRGYVTELGKRSSQCVPYAELRKRLPYCSLI